MDRILFFYPARAPRTDSYCDRLRGNAGMLECYTEDIISIIEECWNAYGMPECWNAGMLECHRML